MYGYILTMVILGWIAFILQIVLLGLGITPKVKTRGDIAFSALFGLAFTLWATYLLIKGN